MCQASGLVTSPLHPESYSHDLYCEWVIRLPPEDRWVTVGVIMSTKRLT